MIDFVEGKLASKSPEAVTVNVGGVGLHALVPMSTYAEMPAPGESAKLLTYLYVREDQLTLYGFATEQERSLFTRLLDVNRIGPSVAMKVLSSCPVDDFRRLVSSGDVKSLASMVKGVGKKTARRLILELEGELADSEEDAEAPISSPEAATAVKALVELGVDVGEARSRVRDKIKELGQDTDSSTLVSAVMQE
ncbi:MAG: Holliday junction branch migration protein RuvA [Planctomycetota bacterium]